MVSPTYGDTVYLGLEPMLDMLLSRTGPDRQKKKYPDRKMLTLVLKSKWTNRLLNTQDIAIWSILCVAKLKP